MTDDALFGAITTVLDTEHGTLTVSGPNVPEVVVSRRPGAATEAYIPIGTRGADELTVTVDGAVGTIKPSKGRLTRRSFAVDVSYAGTAYRLVPDSLDGSRLLRGRRRIGTFTSAGDGTVPVAEWIEGADARPLDAAVGYALAAAFGTGAQPMWMLTLEAVSAVLPG
ncbi:hypothetical protein [Streptomyces sp. I05A-00742]|uniref:hypothetical protein n=1 Tax=Streptomyces sp. I05A-00742 TaxID=2732853 RepID=UPI00148881B9|nr:hypothetical protein [Streptomyces sp. I05A-00742]